MDEESCSAQFTQMCHFGDERVMQSAADKTLAPLCPPAPHLDCVRVGRAAVTAVNGRVTQASVSDYVRKWTERRIMNTFLRAEHTAAARWADFHILQQKRTEANEDATLCPALSTQLCDVGRKEKKQKQNMDK